MKEKEEFRISPATLEPARDRRTEGGMTLIEMMIVVIILATIATIGMSMYASALLSARITKAKQDLRTISTAIAIYRSKSPFDLPLTLYEVGHGGRLDPWSHPYMYLNFHSGTGSGMQFVMENGLVDPVAVQRLRESEGSKGKAKAIQNVQERSAGRSPLDAAGVEAIKRKDRQLFPLNTDYDLFSVGPNGKALASLVTDYSLDDVIRANDGGFFGLASDY